MTLVYRGLRRREDGFRTCLLAETAVRSWPNVHLSYDPALLSVAEGSF
jgi:hypothetical protein